jgi:hypothetical protein
LHLACKYSNDKVFRLLIESDKLCLSHICNTSFNTSPLHCACRSKNQNHMIVEKLLKKIIELKLKETLEKHLDANFREKLIHILIPIVICRFELTTEDIEKHINEKEFDLNKFEFIRIVDETSCYLKEIVNLQDSFEKRPLQLAIEHNFLDVTSVLFKFGALSMLYGPNQTLPIHVAAKTGSVPMFWLLAKHNSVSFKTDGSMNLFHLASLYNNYDFLKAACDYFNQKIEDSNLYNNFQLALDAINLDYMTPLFLAISKSNINCVKVLDQAKRSSKFYVDDLGRNIFHICCLYDSANTFEYLIHFIGNNTDNDSIESDHNYFEKTNYDPNSNELVHFGQINQSFGFNSSLKIQTYHVYNTGN